MLELIDNSTTVDAGACVELMSALAMAFPGYAASLASKTSLLGNYTGSSHSGGSHSSHDLPMLKHVQRVWEGAAGVYPVTTAFLSLTETLVIAGVNKACVKVGRCACLTINWICCAPLPLCLWSVLFLITKNAHHLYFGLC